MYRLYKDMHVGSWVPKQQIELAPFFILFKAYTHPSILTFHAYTHLLSSCTEQRAAVQDKI